MHELRLGCTVAVGQRRPSLAAHLACRSFSSPGEHSQQGRTRVSMVVTRQGGECDSTVGCLEMACLRRLFAGQPLASRLPPRLFSPIGPTLTPHPSLSPIRQAAETLLERWVVHYYPQLPEGPSHLSRSQLSRLNPQSVYKRLVITLRSLYTYLRVLPAYRMARACKVRGWAAEGQGAVQAGLCSGSSGGCVLPARQLDHRLTSQQSSRSQLSPPLGSALPS